MNRNLFLETIVPALPKPYYWIIHDLQPTATIVKLTIYQNIFLIPRKIATRIVICNETNFFQDVIIKAKYFMKENNLN